jgi:hypothetical protein
MVSSKFLGGAVLAGALGVAVVAYAAEVMNIIDREAAIRRDKRTYSPRLATVIEKDAVEVIAKEPPWLKVRFGGVEGWILESSVTSDPEYVYSGEASRGVRVTEQGAAKRGFSPEVEKQYRKENPDLEAAFATLKMIEEGWVYPDDRVIAFMEEGKITPPAEGGSR